MRFRSLSCCGVAATMMLSAGAYAQVAQDPAADGPRLIGRGAPLSAVEQVAYAVKVQLCPQELRASLVGGDLSDREMIMLAVIVGLALAVVIVAVAD